MITGVSWYPAGSFTTVEDQKDPTAKEVILKIQRRAGCCRSQVVECYGLCLLCFYNMGSNRALYTINLKTMQPTQKSQLQDALSASLEDQLRKYVLPVLYDVDALNESLLYK